MVPIDIETGLSHAPSNDGSVSSSSVPMEVDEGFLPYIHYIMFGKGINALIPVGVCILFTVQEVYLLIRAVESESIIGFICNMAFLIECYVNLGFGYMMLQSQRIHQVLYCTQDHNRRQHYVHVLQGICGVSYVFAWINQGFWFAPVKMNSNDDDGFGSNNRIAYAFSSLLF